MVVPEYAVPSLQVAVTVAEGAAADGAALLAGAIGAGVVAAGADGAAGAGWAKAEDPNRALLANNRINFFMGISRKGTRKYVHSFFNAAMPER